MKLPDVLILGGAATRCMEQLVHDTGRSAIVATNLISAMKQLQRNKYATVVIDYAHVRTDILEFLLNLREVTEDVRVFVVGTDMSEDEILLGQDVPWVSFVDEDVLRRKLTPTRVGNRQESHPKHTTSKD